jgi:hypothetical protein
MVTRKSPDTQDNCQSGFPVQARGREAWPNTNKERTYTDASGVVHAGILDGRINEDVSVESTCALWELAGERGSSTGVKSLGCRRNDCRAIARMKSRQTN